MTIQFTHHEHKYDGIKKGKNQRVAMTHIPRQTALIWQAFRESTWASNNPFRDAKLPVTNVLRNEKAHWHALFWQHFWRIVCLSISSVFKTAASGKLVRVPRVFVLVYFEVCEGCSSLTVLCDYFLMLTSIFLRTRRQYPSRKCCGMFSACLVVLTCLLHSYHRVA